MAEHVYDQELGKITDHDRECASEIIDEVEENIAEGRTEQIRLIAEWVRKIRYEAVIADRSRRSAA